MRNLTGHPEKKYNGRLIPQHIHFNINAKGYSNQNLQIAFEDDPAMKDIYWKEWAAKANYPIIKIAMKENIGMGNLNIHLIKK